MRRRDFIALFGGAAAFPLAARAQQPATPVIGFLTFRAPGEVPQLMAAFGQGLRDAGFVEGQNVTIEYRFARNQGERLPELAADLVRRQVAVIAAPTTSAALAAKAATTSIPVVFETGGDPVQLGLVASLNRPGGNVTGVTQLNVEVAPKRLELLHELIPAATTMAVLVNPSETVFTQAVLREMESAAGKLGLQLHVLNASAERDFEGAFAKLVQLRADGLVIGGGALLIARQQQLGALAARHAIPAVGLSREFIAAGGLLSYGGDTANAYRLVGVYSARILKGEKPDELPVQEGVKVELLVNLKTAKALGINFPLSMLGRADEVIE